MNQAAGVTMAALGLSFIGACLGCAHQTKRNGLMPALHDDLKLDLSVVFIEDRHDEISIAPSI
jgi:hypothetical protein